MKEEFCGRTILERLASLETEVANLKAAAAHRWQTWSAIILALIAIGIAYFKKG